MPLGIESFLPALPPLLPLPRFLVSEIVGEESNPLAPEELRELEDKYGTWAARLAEAFAVDLPSAERIARGLSERIIRRF